MRAFPFPAPRQLGRVAPSAPRRGGGETVARPADWQPSATRATLAALAVSGRYLRDQPMTPQELAAMARDVFAGLVPMSVWVEAMRKAGAQQRG